MGHRTYQDMLADAKSRVKEISIRDAQAALKSGEPVVFLDVRDPNEVNLGKIPGAVAISRGNLESKVEALVPRDARVIVYCARANRSAFAALTLAEMGYGDVASMAGGFTEWVMNDGDVEG